MVTYNESLSFDKVFYAQDIAGNIAWARANKNIGILSEHDFSEIERGLAQISQEWSSHTFEIKPTMEDIHTANESRLGEIIGMEIAGKMHTGRSRNDQVATDMRLWLRDELQKIDDLLVELLKVICSRAELEIEHVMPGYTVFPCRRWNSWMYGRLTTALALKSRPAH